MQTNGTRRLSIGKKMPRGYAARNSLSSSVFLVPDGIFDLLNRPVAVWRSKKLARFTVPEVSQLLVRYRNKERKLLLTSGRWTDAGDVSGDTTIESAVLDLLTTARDLMAQDFIGRPSAQTGDFQRPTLQLFFTTSEYSQTLRIVDKPGRIYAQSGIGRTPSAPLDETVYVLPPDTLERFAPALNVLFPDAQQ
jgi:hypothetical protein